MIHAVEISERVVGEGLDRFGLEEGPEDGENNDRSSIEAIAHNVGVGLQATANRTQNHAADDVIGLEVGLGQEEANDGDSVELRVLEREGILSTQQGEEIVSPEIVADESEGSNPEVGLESVATMPSDLALSRRHEDHGKDETRNKDDETNGVVAEIADTLQREGVKRRKKKKSCKSSVRME